MKGPSAATEYGTDAANGVIVIKTKRGQVGPPRWDINTEQGISTVPVSFPLNWHGWGHTTDGTNTSVICPRTTALGFGPSVGAGTCAIDSVTTYQALDHPGTAELGTGYSQRYNLATSGGGQQLQYFVAGSYGSQTGVQRLDPVDAQVMLDSTGSIPSYARTPNVTNGATLHGRFALPLANTASLTVSTGYISNYQRSGDARAVVGAAEGGLGYNDPIYHGWEPFFTGYLPSSAFLNTASQTISRFTGGTTLTWRPASWLSTHGTVGVDAGTENDLSFRRPGSDPTFYTYHAGTLGGGYRSSERQTTNVYTVDVGGSATASIARGLNSTTSVGVQYNDSRQSGTTVLAYGISPSNSLNGAAVSLPGEISNYAKTFGSYAEEMLGWHDRLFLSGAVRVDAGSGFGRQANSAVYPKASASWVLWDTPGQSVRLRAAYGASGVQPKAGSTLTLYASSPVLVGGAVASGDTLTAIANPQLKPERQTEFESGIDASVLDRRVDVALTYYTKLSQDALVNVTLPASLGARTQEENIGSVRNYGVEGTVTAHVIDAQRLQWDVTAGGSVNTNRLVKLAKGVPPIEGNSISATQYRDVPGYPVYGMWAPLLHVNDVNHDGIVEANEVSMDSTMSYIGPGLPSRELTLSTRLGLWRGRVRIGAQFDHRGGYRLENFNWLNNLDSDPFPTSPALNDPHAPLWEQGRAIEALAVYSPLNSAYMEDGTFTRWRELSIQYVLPMALVRAVRGRSAALTVSGRNLALWTRYTGPDPEVTTPGAYGGRVDESLDIYSFPLLRTWMVRLDVGI